MCLCGLLCIAGIPECFLTCGRIPRWFGGILFPRIGRRLGLIFRRRFGLFFRRRFGFRLLHHRVDVADGSVVGGGDIVGGELLVGGRVIADTVALDLIAVPAFLNGIVVADTLRVVVVLVMSEPRVRY